MMDWTEGPRAMWVGPLTALRQAIVLHLQLTAGVCDILTDWLQGDSVDEAKAEAWYDAVEEALPGW